MEQCEYGRGEKKTQYYDYDDKQHVVYDCPLNALANKNDCEFHNNEYTQNNPDVVMKLFYAIVGEAMQKAIPLLCIGFIFHGKLTLQTRNLGMGFNFSHATFTEGEDFFLVTFTKGGIFSHAIFVNSLGMVLNGQFARC